MSNHRNTHHETAPEDRLPFKEKLGLALGSFGNSGVQGVLINFIFVMEIGISPALVSVLGFVNSIVSSLLSPVIGQFADDFRSPWGRRKPLIVMASIPMIFFGCVTYAFPRGLSEHGLAAWIFLCGLLSIVPTQVFSLSLGGLTTEAVRDYHERVRLNSFLMFASLTFNLATQWLYPLIKNAIPPLVIPWGKVALTFHFPVFSSPISGAQWIVFSSAAFSLVCAQLPAILCPETRYAQIKKTQPKGKLLPSLKEAAKNRQFLIILSIKFFTFFCYNVVAVLGVYMNTYFVFGGDKARGAVVYGFLGSSYIVAATLSLFFYRWLEPKLGKVRILQIAAAILLVGCVCKLIVYRPSMPWLQLFVLVSNGISITGLHLMTTSMFGDIIDYDELLHHKRREALFGSIFSWAEQQGASLGGLLCGFMLMWIGFDAKLDGSQSWATLHLMRFFYFLFPFCGALFAFFVVRGYKLTEDRMYEIRDELRKRYAGEAPRVWCAREVGVNADDKSLRCN